MTHSAPCPFCGLLVIKDDEALTVLHEAPQCKSFYALLQGKKVTTKVVPAEQLAEHLKATRKRVKASRS